MRHVFRSQSSLKSNRIHEQQNAQQAVGKDVRNFWWRWDDDDNNIGWEEASDYFVVLFEAFLKALMYFNLKAPAKGGALYNKLNS